MIKLNTNFSEQVTIETSKQDWTESPVTGVLRKRLEREESESGLASSIVKYQAQASFPHHIHPGGEEYYVLEGVFSDERGDYKAGSYVRNPPYSNHSPYSRDGCTLFVKLCQMPPSDEEALVVDSLKLPFFYKSEYYGYQMLYQSKFETVQINQLTKLNQPILISNPSGIEILTIEGHLIVNDVVLPRLSWCRFPPGAAVQLSTDEHCRYWSKSGHLSSRIIS